MCKNSKRVGHRRDGGWDICLAPDYHIKKPCLVYSVGINHDWSFDDGMAKYYKCKVKSFDPSMGLPDHRRGKLVQFFNTGLGGANEVNKHGWKMKTLGTLLKALKHENKTIDVLKFDAEFSEWSVLETTLKEGSLRNVKQIATELHAWRDTTKDYVYFWRLLVGLHNEGFEKWNVENKRKHPSCFNIQGKWYCPQADMNFINTKYLKTTIA